MLFGNPLLKDTLKVYATASETAEKSEQPMNIEETTEVVDVSKVIDSDNGRKNQMNEWSETENVSPVDVTTDEEFSETLNNSDFEETKIESSYQEIVSNDDLASGTFGTCDWRIDSNGTLYIGAGELGESNISARPWTSYSPNINNIIIEGPVVANEKSVGLFLNLSQVQNIEGLEYLDTSHVSDMSYMFSGMKNLRNLNVSNFNTTQVTNMFAMFSSTSKLTSLDISTFNTSNITNMGSIFSGMSSLIELKLSGIDTQNVINFTNMFSGVSSLSSLDLSGFNTSSAINMSSMFDGAKSLISLDISSFDTKSVTNMNSMFNNVESLTTLNVSSFNTSAVTSMNSMFANMKSLIEIDTTNFDTSHVTDMGSMFWNDESLASVDISSFDTSKVGNMSYMFNGMKNLTYLDLSYIDNQNEYTQLFGFLEGTNKLQQLVLGPNLKLYSSSNLPEIFADDQFTGYWQNVSSGTLDFPQGTNILTSTELLNKYDGNSMADTYVWQKTKLSISANDSTIYVGDVWNPEDNFDSATDVDGNNIMFSIYMIEGFVDTEKTGIYSVIFKNGSASQEIIVTVKENKTDIKTKDSTIYRGDTWNPEDNFESALDKDGTTVNFKDIEIDQNDLDTSKEGVYEVTYSFGGVTNTAKITVVNDNKDEKDEIKNSENNNNKSSNDSKGEMNKNDEQKNIDKNQIDENKTQDNLPATASVETTVWEYLIGGSIIISALILYYLKKAKY